MNTNKIILLICCCTLFFPSIQTFAQGSSEYAGGYKVKLNESGSKYFRIVAWGQFQANIRDNDAGKNLDLSVRRARILTYFQLNPKFLILTHFGLNSLNSDNLSPTGKGASSQLFFHDFWGEYKVIKNHAIGIGLHYWNGISRLNNSSTLNFLRVDNNRQSWSTIGLTDQFARHLGIYLKGKFGKLQYRVAMNEALTNNLQASADPVIDGAAVYAGKRLLGSDRAGFVYAGYFDYHFLDAESNFLPFKVGSYLGSKKVFNIGAGFFLHPQGSVLRNSANELVGQDVSIWAIDAFYDAPLSVKNDAITAYATYQNYNYGRDYQLGQTYASGNMIYGQVGYLLSGKKDKVRLQPYTSFNLRTINAIDDNATRFSIGANIYLTGHHSKITLEYNNSKYGQNDNVGGLTIQAMVYL